MCNQRVSGIYLIQTYNLLLCRNSFGLSSGVNYGFFEIVSMIWKFRNAMKNTKPNIKVRFILIAHAEFINECQPRNKLLYIASFCFNYFLLYVIVLIYFVYSKCKVEKWFKNCSKCTVNGFLLNTFGKPIFLVKQFWSDHIF